MWMIGYSSVRSCKAIMTFCKGKTGKNHTGLDWETDPEFQLNVRKQPTVP